MKILKNEYKKVITWHIITLYVSFLIVGAIHFHHYDFNSESSYQQKGTENNFLVQDLSNYSSGICVINHFSQSILNYHFSSDGILQTLPKYDRKVSCLNTFSQDLEFYYQISPRAPPVIS
jgi:hypothetical protein